MLVPHQLVPAGSWLGSSPGSQDSRQADLSWTGDVSGQKPLRCTIQWPALAAGRAPLVAGEAVTQAISGLMAVHGRDQHVPQRLALDVVTAATGSLAAQGVLAALIARRRGHPISGVVTYPVRAALLLISHHITAATCGDAWEPPPGGAGPGPPFRTADGHWVELEVLDPDSWRDFWGRLGVQGPQVATAWLAFAFRQNTARCALPMAMHEATAARTLPELMSAAEPNGVALCRVRTPTEAARDGGPFDGRAWSVIRPSAVPALRGGRSEAAADSASTVATVGEHVAPLSGIRVVELTTRIQGPLAAQLLRMLGAEVITVEPPGGDPGRQVPPFAGDTGAAFVAYNRNKRTIELDYKTPAGVATLIDLIATADVFLHNMRPGRVEQLGIAYDDVRSSNPGLVYAAASGWGPRPDPALPALATDSLVQAHAAMGWSLSAPGQDPFPSRATIADAFGGMAAAEAVLGALAHRTVLGSGAHVETSLLSAALELQRPLLPRLLASSPDVVRDRRLPWTPLHAPVRTADGWLALDDADMTAQRRLADATELGSAARLADPGRLAEHLRTRSASEWENRLHAAGISCAAVRTDLSSLPSDVHISAHLEGVAGACDAPAPPWEFSAA